MKCHLNLSSDVNPQYEVKVQILLVQAPYYSLTDTMLVAFTLACYASDIPDLIVIGSILSPHVIRGTH